MAIFGIFDSIFTNFCLKTSSKIPKGPRFSPIFSSKSYQQPLGISMKPFFENFRLFLCGFSAIKSPKLGRNRHFWLDINRFFNKLSRKSSFAGQIELKIYTSTYRYAVSSWLNFQLSSIFQNLIFRC